MEVNKHINFLKRRGLLIEDSSQIELDFGLEDTMDFKKLCSEGSEVFCQLMDLSQKEDVKNNPELSKKLVKSITKIYKHLKPPIKNNRSKFNRLISVILKQKLDNSINTFSIVADVIDDVNIKKLRNNINKLTDSDIQLGDDTLLDIINKIKHQSYTKYENSFIGDHFEPYRTKLQLSYRSEHVINKKLSELLIMVIRGEKTVEYLSQLMYESIIRNFNNGVGKFVKADLKCIKTLKDEYGNGVILEGDYVEVKKLDYKGDSYLSEFFAIYKNPKNLPKILKTDIGIETYNKVIDSLFLRLDSEGQNILETIKNSFSGIIYDENTFIPSKHIELYWSNKGQRIEDHRLTIRYRITDSSFVGYTYNKTSDIMVSENLNVDFVTQKIILPLTINESINYSKNLLKEDLKGDFDWVGDYLKTIPDEPEVLALIKHLGASNVLGDDFKEGYNWYGNIRTILTDNGEEWAVGTTTEMDNALQDYWEGYWEEYLENDYYADYLSEFVDIPYGWVDEFCDSETEDYFYYMSDEEVIEEYADDYDKQELDELDDKYEELQREYQNVEKSITQYKDIIKTMEIQNQDYLSYGYQSPQHSEEDFEKYGLKIESLNSELLYIEKMLDEFIEEEESFKKSLVERLKDEFNENCLECMSPSPIECLVDERGWYNTEMEAINTLGFEINESELIEYLIDDYHDMSHYDGSYDLVDVNGEDYVLIRVD